MYIRQHRFSVLKEIYYYEQRDIVDQGFNGTLVSRSIAARPRVFVLDIPLPFSRSLAFSICSKYIPLDIPSRPPLSLSLTLYLFVLTMIYLTVESTVERARKARFDRSMSSNSDVTNIVASK